MKFAMENQIDIPNPNKVDADKIKKKIIKCIENKQIQASSLKKIPGFEPNLSTVSNMKIYSNYLSIFSVNILRLKNPRQQMLIIEMLSIFPEKKTLT